MSDPSASGDFSTFGPLVETTARVASWNLWWRFGPWQDRLPAILRTVELLEADVICLQEVWRAGDDSPATMIAAAMGGHHVYAPMFEIDGVGFGNAIVSRWPIVAHEHRGLSAPPEFEEHRNVLWAQIDGPRGALQVYCTHLHWRADHSWIRQQQVREICDFIADGPERQYPPVLCGDFNADPDSDEVHLLVGKAAVPRPPLVFWDAWAMAGEGPGITWSNDNPYAALELDVDRRIDYIFTGFPKPGGRGHCVAIDRVGTGSVDGVVPSDHYGLVADLRY
jgi:endonuclease/exonuclease/phosphatase family metal-dependent hydrolase